MILQAQATGDGAALIENEGSAWWVSPCKSIAGLAVPCVPFVHLRLHLQLREVADSTENDSPEDGWASPERRWLDAHTRRLVEETLDLTGELTFTVRHLLLLCAGFRSVRWLQKEVSLRTLMPCTMKGLDIAVTPPCDHDTLH